MIEINPTTGNPSYQSHFIPKKGARDNIFGYAHIFAHILHCASYPKTDDVCPI